MNACHEAAFLTRPPRHLTDPRTSRFSSNSERVFTVCRPVRKQISFNTLTSSKGSPYRPLASPGKNCRIL